MGLRVTRLDAKDVTFGKFEVLLVKPWQMYTLERPASMCMCLLGGVEALLQTNSFTLSEYSKSIQSSSFSSGKKGYPLFLMLYS